MRSLDKLFGESPFKHVVEHARKIYECVGLIRRIADGIIVGDMDRVKELQHQMSKTEYEADQLKDRVRQHLPTRFFLPVARDDILDMVRQLDRMADDAEDFAVVATFRKVFLPPEIQSEFLALVDKVVQVSDMMLSLAEHMAQLQKDSFSGSGADDVLEKIQQVCHMEWETDKLSRVLARKYYSMEGMDAVSIILLDKMSHALTSIADHAENVGKNLRLMILRK